MQLYDLTLNVESDMPTCGTPWHQSVIIEPLGKIETVGRNTSKIVLGSHSGTHMDAPLHFIPDSNDISKLDINILCGDVSIVDFTRFSQGDKIGLEDVKNLNVTKRMLFKFGWFKKWKTKDYYNRFPFFTLEAAQYLFDKGMRLMALDTPSPDDGSAITNVGVDDSPVHKFLLKNGVIIVEYLCNTDLLSPDKKYELYALPLKLAGSDGSPSRVIVKEI